MYSLMCNEVAFGPEAFPTLGALEGLLAGVDSLMQRQATFLPERLPTFLAVIDLLSHSR